MLKSCKNYCENLEVLVVLTEIIRGQLVQVPGIPYCIKEMYKEAIAVFKSVTSVNFHPRILKEVGSYNNSVFHCSFGGLGSVVCRQVF